MVAVGAPELGESWTISQTDAKTAGEPDMPFARGHATRGARTHPVGKGPAPWAGRGCAPRREVPGIITEATRIGVDAGGIGRSDPK